MSGTIAHLNGTPTAGRKINEPLHRFIDAKKHMGAIYNDLESYVNDLFRFYAELSDESKLVPQQQMDEVRRFRESIHTIKEMFGRDKMKVVFFGRTSNGKSTVINAMLHSKILPQGMGHTTSCFLQVEGGSENEKSFIVEGRNQKLPISELEKIGDALSLSEDEDPKLKNSSIHDTLVTIHYPKSSSKLLQNEVVLVDSPGVDLKPEYDTWIDKHCLDADLFVLVCNSESTLTQAEKNFFVRVSKKLSKPNVFILNNRWDASAGDSPVQAEKVRKQHEKRFQEFLEELNVCRRDDEARKRIFFISAREVLEKRLKKPNPYQLEGWAQREQSFNEFERNFEQAISKSAIRTKFEAHEHRAREIIAGMRENVEHVQQLTLREKQKLDLDFKLKQKEFQDCRNNFVQLEESFFNERRRVREEVHLKVSADFYEEINRLDAIIDRFNEPFIDESSQITEYKKLLAYYVDKVVTTDLEDKCSGGLMARIWALENDLYKHVVEIVGSTYAPKLEAVWRYKQPFKFTITIDCVSHLEDFYEDLEFRFSLGPSAILRRLVAYKTGKPITALSQNHVKAALTLNPDAQKNEEDAYMTQMVLTAASYMANGGIGVALIGTLVYKTVGWRVLAAGAVAYGGLYLLERWRWNSGAKEMHLKDQFRSHLAQRLRQVSRMHTTHCEEQVMRELEQVYEGLKGTVGGIHREMKEDLDGTKKNIAHVEEVIKGLQSIKGKTSFLDSSLDSFNEKFLAPDSPSLK